MHVVKSDLQGPLDSWLLIADFQKYTNEQFH